MMATTMKIFIIYYHNAFYIQYISNKEQNVYIRYMYIGVLPEGPIVILRDEYNSLINTSLVYKV